MKFKLQASAALVAAYISEGWRLWYGRARRGGRDRSGCPLKLPHRDLCFALPGPQGGFVMFGQILSGFETQLFDEFRRLESELDQLVGRGGAGPTGLRAGRPGGPPGAARGPRAPAPSDAAPSRPLTWARPPIA